MKMKEEIDFLYKQYPIPTSWRVAQGSLSFVLVAFALTLAWGFDLRWWAMIFGLLAAPPLTIRMVAWCSLKLFGKPAAWPDIPK